MTEIIRILRVIEYIGPRAAVERQVVNSKHGDHQFGDVTMKVATVGAFPEVLKAPTLADMEINIRAMNVLRKHFAEDSMVHYIASHTDEYFREIGLRVRDIKEIREVAG